VELPQTTDEVLLRQVAQRDTNALAALYDRHAQTVYNVIARIVQEPALADELLQDTFWQIWQKAGEYQGSGAAAAWIYRIARNKSLDQLRRAKTQPQAISAESAHEVGLFATLTSVADTVEHIAAQSWQQQDIHRALSNIPEEQRASLELAYFEGLTQREIAERMQVPMGTVKTRIKMGLEKVERFLRAAGYQAEDLAP
jgi:RNA polymerase sigma-70 factor, ECF subfamily